MSDRNIYDELMEGFDHLEEQREAQHIKRELAYYERREKVDVLTMILIMVLFLWFDWWAALLLGMGIGMVINIVWDWWEGRKDAKSFG